MDVSVKHLVPEKLPPFVLQKASEAQQAAKAITQAAEVNSLGCSHPLDQSLCLQLPSSCGHACAVDSIVELCCPLDV